MTNILNVPKAEGFSTTGFCEDDSNALRPEISESLKQCEQQWWQARQHLVTLEERKMFWYGESSTIMWLLWQMVSYVVVAIIMLLLVKVLDMSLSAWHYMTVFGVQTLLFMLVFVYKSKLFNHLQSKIDLANLAREQALNEMAILAADSILPDIHAHAPLSLQQIYERYDAQFRMASLQRLLQKEVDSGRLVLEQHQIEAQVLPPELVEEGLLPEPKEMVYRSLIAAG